MSKPNRRPLNGAAGDIIGGLNANRITADVVSAKARALRKFGLSDTVIKIQLEAAIGDLSDHGIGFNGDTRRLVFPKSTTSSRIESVARTPAEHARALHAQAFSKLAPVLLIPDLAHLSTGKRRNVSPQPNAAVRQLQDAVEKGDTASATRVISATPAISQATVYQKPFSGRSEEFSPIEENPSMVIDTAMSVTPAGWVWPAAADRSHTWHAGRVDGARVPVIVETVELGNSTTLFSAASKQEYERTVSLEVRHLFVPDGDFLSLFDVDLSLLPEIGDPDAKPDQDGLSGYMNELDSLAPSAGVLVVTQQFMEAS